MKQKLQTLKGFRDFLPKEKRKRDFVVSKVREVFERFGFEPLETPTLEYASLLLGKYGDEADKLVYTFEDSGGRKVGLKYDQTVPISRVLTQYKNELPKYFRRYQIQNVYRAEKPQKGRYREFSQCDIDIFGSSSPLADAEIVAATYFAFENVGYPKVILKVNDRQILIKTLDPYSSEKVPVMSIIQSVDKLDKKSKDEVLAELVKKGLTGSKAKQALEDINKAEMSDNLRDIVSNAKQLGVPEKVIEFSPYLARGLDYYTGMIIEVVMPDYKVGSFGGGGRYDKLIGELGGEDVPAVGIAFGLDRMVEAAGELGLIPTGNIGTKVLVTVFDDSTVDTSLETANKLRRAGIETELYPSLDKLSKQLGEASKNKIPYVVIIGPDEKKKKMVTLKDMNKKTEESLTVDQVIERLGS